MDQPLFGRSAARFENSENTSLFRTLVGEAPDRPGAWLKVPAATAVA